MWGRDTTGVTPAGLDLRGDPAPNFRGELAPDLHDEPEPESRGDLCAATAFAGAAPSPNGDAAISFADIVLGAGPCTPSRADLDHRKSRRGTNWGSLERLHRQQQHVPQVPQL